SSDVCSSDLFDGASFQSQCAGISFKSSSVIPYLSGFNKFDSSFFLPTGSISASKWPNLRMASIHLFAAVIFLTSSLEKPFPFPVLAVDVVSEEHTSELQSRFGLVCRLL